MTAHGPAGDGSGDVLRPALRLEYTSFDPASVAISWLESEPGDPDPPALGDRDVALVGLDDTPLPGILLASERDADLLAEQRSRRLGASASPGADAIRSGCS
jgi:hypothetical protein